MELLPQGLDNEHLNGIDVQLRKCQVQVAPANFVGLLVPFVFNDVSPGGQADPRIRGTFENIDLILLVTQNNAHMIVLTVGE